MAGGTLVVSREPKMFPYIKCWMENLGFTNVHTTDLDKDGLSFLIDEIKPDALIMSPRFYQCATPYRLGELYQKYPKLYLAVISIGEFPADVALRFVANGVKAFVCTADGIEQFNVGLEAIRNRKPFIPSFVQERIDLRKEYPAPSRMLTPIMTEVLRCICNGFCKEHIADTLSISERTVEKHRQELYRSLNARTPYDLYRNAQQQGFVTIDELDFCHRNLECTPLPEKHKKKKAKAVH